MAICPNETCQLSKLKAPQFGAKCMKCQTPLPVSIPTGSTTSTAVETVKLTAQDWKDAARWAIAIDPAFRGQGNDEAVVRKYWQQYGGGMALEDDDVAELAQQGRKRQEGINLIDDWASFVTRTLPRMGSSGAFSSGVATKWDKLSQLIRDHLATMASQDLICTGQMTGGGGATIVLNYALLDEPASMRLALAHETGHVVDILLRCNHADTDLQKCLLKKDAYTPKVANDHDLEYFADSFATVLLFAGGILGPELAKAAHALFKGGTVTDEHPSGADRISNIARVALRHVSPR